MSRTPREWAIWHEQRREAQRQERIRALGLRATYAQIPLTQALQSLSLSTDPNTLTPEELTRTERYLTALHAARTARSADAFDRLSPPEQERMFAALLR